MMSLFEGLVKKRVFVLMFLGALVLSGIYGVKTLSVDAVPDITNVQVMINAPTGALDPEQIEKSVTQVIEIEMAGLPRLAEVRSISKYGLSQVNLIFEDGTSLNEARTFVDQRLQNLSAQLPAGIVAMMAPPITGLGEIFMYTLNSRKPDENTPIYLRTVQEQIVRPALRKVPGVAEVDTGGGYEKQIHINLDPVKMKKMGLRLEHITEKLQTLGESFGGGYIEGRGQQILVKSSSSSDSLSVLQNFPLRVDYSGRFVRLKDVATIAWGKPLRVGAATASGHETVLGTVLMNMGANTKEVTAGIESALSQLQLPEDVSLKVMYSRKFLVNKTLQTVSKNLLEGALLVFLVLFVFLGRWSVAGVVGLAIPLSMCVAVLSMGKFHITANLMSLGALDFGLLVDGSVVFIENIYRHAKASTDRLQTVIAKACAEVAKPVLIGLTVITVVYVPILWLEGTEGKLFHPMAVTVISALIGSLVVAFIFMPVLGFYVFRSQKKAIESSETKVFKWMQNTYSRRLTAALTSRLIVPIGVAALVLLSLTAFLKTGSEFVPQLSEGDIVVGIARDPKISLSESVAQQREVETLLEQLPEVEHVFSRLGTPESGTDPMGVNFADTFVILKKDYKQRSVDELIPVVQKTIADRFPDADLGMTQPIEMRFNEMLEGSRADVTLRFYGPDLKELLKYVETTVAILEDMPNIREVQVDALTALRESPTLDVRLDYEKMLAHNVNLENVNRTLQSLMAGESVGFYHDGVWRYPVFVRISEEFRAQLGALGDLPVSTMDGGQVPLREVAKLQIEDRVTTIARSFGKRYGAVSIFLKGTDIEGFVAEARQKLQNELKIQPGYTVEWGGQFKNLERARLRLLIIVPLTLLAILCLVYFNFGNLKVSFLVLSGVPFAVSGGWISLWISQTEFSVSAAVGFIAVMGISILNGMVLMEFILDLVKHGKAWNEAIYEGALARLRPVLMTALVAAFGFLPMIFSSGIGAEVQRPLATVVVGGIITATFSTLFVLPYLLRRIRSLERSLS